MIAVGRALLGLFVEDEFLAGAVVGVVAVTALLFLLIGVQPLLAGACLLAGASLCSCLGLCSRHAARSARKRVGCSATPWLIAIEVTRRRVANCCAADVMPGVCTPHLSFTPSRASIANNGAKSTQPLNISVHRVRIL
jgi:hypothetical protein